MTNETTRREIIDEGRAAYLLGLPKEQLREICELSGLGHLEEGTTALRLGVHVRGIVQAVPVDRRPDFVGSRHRLIRD